MSSLQYFLLKTEVSNFIMDFSFIRTHLQLILVTFYLGSYLITEFEYFLSKTLITFYLVFITSSGYNSILVIVDCLS